MVSEPTLRNAARLLVLYAIFALAGCGGQRSTITVERTKSPLPLPNRVLIVSYLGGGFEGDWSAGQTGPIIGSLLTEAFTTCGIAADYLPVSSVSLTNPVPDAVKRFSPDVIMTIQEASHVTQGPGVSVINVTYHMELMDMRSKLVPWRANMVFWPSDTSNERRPAYFVQAIKLRLQGDGELPANCPAK